MSSEQQSQMNAKVTTSHLQKNWGLLKQIQVKEILDDMIEESLVSIEQSKAIMSEKTDSMQAEALLYHVFSNPQRYLDSFLMILAKNGYEHIVKKLREDSTETSSKDNTTASPSTKEKRNVAQTDVVPVDTVRLLLKEAVGELKRDIKEATEVVQLKEAVSDLTKSNDEILKELKQIKDSQEVVQRDIAGVKKERENDKEKYAHLQDQFIKLKEKKEEATKRLKELTMKKCELERNLDKLETERKNLQQEIETLKKRQSGLAVNQNEIELNEKEIERLKKRISELEETIASGKEEHKKDTLQIRDLKEQLEKIKEKEAPVKGKKKVLNEAEDVKERNYNLPAIWRSIPSGMQSKRDLTVQPISLNALKIFRSSRRSHMRRPHNGTNHSQNYGTYDVPRERAFDGTSLPDLSDNAAYTKGEKSSRKLYHK